MAKSRVFLDSSVLVSALLSSRGGSFYILNQLRDEFEFLINDYVFEETLGVLNEKFTIREDLKDKLFLLMGLTPIKILKSPHSDELKTLSNIINKKDAPILVSALKYSHYFLTLDNDFFAEPVIKFSKKKKLSILKPREFIQKFRKGR